MDDPAGLVRATESAPTEPDPPIFVHSPVNQNDSIFELAEDPTPKRQKIAESEATFSPNPVNHPF